MKASSKRTNVNVVTAVTAKATKATKAATDPHLDTPAHSGLPPRVQRLMSGPTWRDASRDPDFLQRPDMRGLRLQLEYEKAQRGLQAAGIDHTVVVYGASRTLDPAVARKHFAQARRALRAQPDDHTLQAAVHAAGRLVERSASYEVARELGRLVGASKATATLPKLTIVTGGGPGIMAASNRGASEAGAPSVGLNITLPHEQFPNPWQSPELCFRFHYFGIRKLHLLERAKAAVFFPGGYGTLDELFEVLTLLQTRKITPLPVVLVGSAFWHKAVNFEFLADEGMIDHVDKALFTFCETADEIWSTIRDWYAAAQPRRTNHGRGKGR
ncbi:MAG: LOG family protein [Paraburkholderia sp.]|uniref:LOG family protein n=1 Tax=Paraburkholderia sp. TaxID=1926495 RepID=UPI001211E1A4|nr:LOG family protein [Paraburkholderia sp.]TAM02720.1 MAG: LOG family protein [Paraburkholderia sp.]TAM30935.1 MAG: LOG family protein [Paraburkholderia sp.]